MLFLQTVRYTQPPLHVAGTFPFNVPIIQSFTGLEFGSAVTFFVGENGSGKSTLLEALAASANLPTVGSDSTDRDPTLAPARRLAKHLRLVWHHRTHYGFFMRSEDFFGYAKRITSLRTELEQELQEIEEEYRDSSSFARSQARRAHDKSVGRCASSMVTVLMLSRMVKATLNCFNLVLCRMGCISLTNQRRPYRR